jgi:hypothetical protein
MDLTSLFEVFVCFVVKFEDVDVDEFQYLAHISFLVEERFVLSKHR